MGYIIYPIKCPESIHIPARILGQDNNDRQVPQHFVIYRGFVEDEDYPSLEVELKSLQAVLNVAAKQTREEYVPEITYIAVAKQDRNVGKAWTSYKKEQVCSRFACYILGLVDIHWIDIDHMDIRWGWVKIQDHWF